MVDRISFGLGGQFRAYLLLMFVAMYFLVHHAQRFAWGSAPFRFYLKDFLILPMVMSAVGITMAIFKKNFNPGKKETAIAVLYVTLVFEAGLPFFGTGIASDPLDVVFYALGGIFYHVLLRDIHRISPKLKTT